MRKFLGKVIDWDVCEEGVDTRELPATCQEFATDPMALHEKLDQWGFDVLEIPHGTTWGTYTPSGTDISKHLDPKQYDPDKQTLIEVMSGHGNSERYQSFREFELAEDGSRTCPEPVWVETPMLPLQVAAAEKWHSLWDGVWFLPWAVFFEGALA